MPDLPRRLTISLYSLIAIGCLFQGVRYLSATELMPYHLDVVGKTWFQIRTADQQLLLGLLKGFGSGSLAIGVTLACLVVRMRSTNDMWTHAIAASTALAYSAAIVYTTHVALLADATPIVISRIVFVLAVSASCGSIFCLRSESKR
jgi:hypothetical protein